MRLLEWGVRLRVALFRMPYGDQALFVRREVLDAVGGVPQAPVMEDLDLVMRLKRARTPGDPGRGGGDLGAPLPEAGRAPHAAGGTSSRSGPGGLGEWIRVWRIAERRAR